MQTSTQARIESKQLGDAVWLVFLAGELDLAAAPRLHRALERALEQGATAIVVDLDGVTFLDSTTIALLIRTVRRLRPSGGRLLCAGGCPLVLRVFRLTGTDRLFEFAPSVGAAVSALEPVGIPTAA